MKFKRIIRATVGGFLMLVMTFTFLPALVINPEMYDSFKTSWIISIKNNNTKYNAAKV